MIIILPRDYSSCFFGYSGTAVIFQNGKYLANLWSFARGWGEFGPLFLNFLDPPLTVSRSEPSIMLRNVYLVYLGYLTQLCLGVGEFGNVTQNLGGEFNTVWDR